VGPAPPGGGLDHLAPDPGGGRGRRVANVCPSCVRRVWWPAPAAGMLRGPAVWEVFCQCPGAHTPAGPAPQTCSRRRIRRDPMTTTRYTLRYLRYALSYASAVAFKIVLN